MNPARVAALLRELADAIEEEEAPEAVPSQQPRAKRVRRAPALTRPAGGASPVVAGQAARILRERGLA